MLDAELFLQPELNNFSAVARTSLRIWQPATIKTRVCLTLSLSHTNNGFISRQTISQASSSGRAVEGVVLRPLSVEIVGSNPTENMDVSSAVSVVCCQVGVFATNWSLVQRSPTD